MDIIIKNGLVYSPDGFRKEDLLIRDTYVAARGENLEAPEWCRVIDAGGAHVLPGLVDVHVHLREPGFSYKETIKTGTMAAAKGGFTTVCPMPNLKPAPDSLENLREELKIIDRDACVETIPYATITKSRLGSELVDYARLAPYVAGFSDDGSGVQDPEVMYKAMVAVAPTGKRVVAHCEVNSLLRGGYIHDGEYARANGHRGISSESEWKEVERDIILASMAGCPLHICHISTKESVDLIRKAKAEGKDVTCETAAHYLAFEDMDIREDGRFKMNPPIRSRLDREALLEGLKDGTIDVIASDHAPHSQEEKSRGLEKSAMGVTGLEVSLPAVYTYVCKNGDISLQRLVELMALNPRRIFGIKGGVEIGDRADVTVVNLDAQFLVNTDDFVSMGKSSPFDNCELNGVVLATIHNGKIVYEKLR